MILTKMKSNVKERWLEMLRSGEYKQAKGRLNNGKAFCCLGVLCDIYIKETGNAGWVPNQDLPSNTYDFMGDSGNEPYSLPEEVIEWAGIVEIDNPHNYDLNRVPIKVEMWNDEIYSLDMLNDKSLSDFETVANVIEEYVGEY